MPSKKATAIRSTAKADARRLEIVNAAAMLFNEHGPDRVSMDDIAQEVGLAKPTLYHYFASKELILYTIHDNLSVGLLERLAARYNLLVSPIEKLRGVFVDMFETMDTHPGHARVFFENFRTLDNDYRRTVRRTQRKYEDMVEQIIKDCISSGLVREIDPRLASLALFGMINWSYYWYLPSGPYRAADVASQFFDFFVSGVGMPDVPLESPDGVVTALSPPDRTRSAKPRIATARIRRI